MLSVLQLPTPALLLHLIFFVSACRRALSVGLLVTMFAAATALRATPIQPTAKQLVQELQRPRAKFEPARVGWYSPQKPAPNFSLTLEQYGPQATARAVRASLIAALTPDPLAMMALLFCAFALRWMQMRKQPTVEPATALAAEENALPRAA